MSTWRPDRRNPAAVAPPGHSLRVYPEQLGNLARSEQPLVHVWDVHGIGTATWMLLVWKSFLTSPNVW
jgi:hypothetical protein